MIAQPNVVAADGVVAYTRDGDDVEVVVQFRPFGEQLPRRLGSARGVTATLDDANHTKLKVRSVRIERDRLHVVVAAGDAQRFTLRFDGVIHGSDRVAVSLLDDAAFDPKQGTAAAEPDAARTLVDYLSKDFRSFKLLMLDSIAHKAPSFVEQHEADAAIALIDVLAFAADSLSYFQDAVATEAYLETARRRVSVRRHARLLGYTLSEGCTPRVWLQVEPSVVFELTRDFKACTALDPKRVFQPLADVWLDPAIHTMSLRVDGGDEVALRKGATSATLVRSGTGPSPALRRGTVLIFEEGRDPATGLLPAQRNRQAVRLNAPPVHRAHPTDAGMLLTHVTWYDDDALTIDLRARTAIVRGNIVPADYGDTQAEFPLQLDAFSAANATLRVALTDLTFAVPYASDEPAKAFTELDPRAAVPSLLQIKATSFDERMEWRPKADLIAAYRFERVFAVEVERSAAVLLRFGDGTNGERPDPSSRFTLTYRQGSGIDGHVGAKTITELVDDTDPRVMSVTNPLPSAGGQLPEDIAQAKRWAPDEIRVQRRCITEGDYERVAQTAPGVTAYARRRWTGDRETVDVYVDAPGDLQRTIARVRAVLASARLIGADVVVHPPRRIPVAVNLSIHTTPGAQPPEVARNVTASLQAALEKRKLTLGSTLFASWLIVAARDVAGVADVELQTFARLGGPDMRHEGFITVGPAELAVFVDESGTTTNGLPVIELAASRDAAP